MNTHKNILAVIPKSIPQAKHWLAVMERDLQAAKTYKAIRGIERVAEALKLLFADVREVREAAERTIMVAKHRIATELRAVPKATASGKGQKRTESRKPAKSGRASTGIAKDTRSRLGKLASVPIETVKGIVAELHAAGKEASEAAVLRELKGEEIKQERKAFEARPDKGGRVADLQAMIDAGETFPVIVPDCPWKFKVYSDKGKQRSPERYYDVSSLKALKAFASKYIAPLLAKDFVLMLWGMWPELPGALEVIEAVAGAEYKTVAFVWVKTTKNAEVIKHDGDGLLTEVKGSGVHTGMALSGSLANSEFVLLATRGSQQRMAKDVHQIVIAPVGEHSEKPAEVYRRIERLYNGPYLELFARKPRQGWTVWGEEVEAETAEAAE